MSKFHTLLLTSLFALTGLLFACGGPDEGELEADEAAAATGYATQTSVNTAYNACVAQCNRTPPPPKKGDPLSGGPCTMYCCEQPGAVGIGADGEVIFASGCL
jgi:hypothetical protein